MKNVITLLALVFSTSLFAQNKIEHYNCEAYVGKAGIEKFAATSGITVDEVETTLKDKGFTAVNFYEGNIKDQFGAGIAESLLDVAIVEKLEGKAGPFARFDVNEYIAIIGTNIGVQKLDTQTVVGKKKLLQTKKAFAKKLGTLILDQIPTCEIP